MNRVTWALAAVVVALEIPYPLVHGDVRNALTVATVLTFATASVVHAAAVDGTRAAIALVVIAGIGGFVAETIGVHTGVPFGDYRYTGGLGFSVYGVPLVIPLAWVMMARPAMLVAGRVTTTTWAAVGVAAVALASWDVFLDPQMVDAHHWRWSSPDPHLPGIRSVPLTNFGGWLLVAAVLMACLHLARRTGPEPRRRDAPMVALWLWTWLSSTFANLVFFGRPAVAAWGFAAMALVGIPLLVRLRAESV